MSERYRTNLDSPIGTLVLVADGVGLRHLHLPGPAKSEVTDVPEDPKRFSAAREQLDAYWSGELVTFDLPLAPVGTPFREKVWDAMLGVPYGATISYGELARRIARPKAVRAVGAACGSNPLPILIPCHRIVGANGALTGYGGGLPIKKKLLALERRA